MIDFNKDPYYDDFKVGKNFYRVLFKPSLAVQTRELNQLQSILQNQVDVFGKHIFKEGAMVIPGHASVDTNATYVRVQGNTLISDIIGKTVRGSVSGTKATIIFAVAQTPTESTTFFVKYKSSGDNNATKTFAASEDLVDDSNGSFVATVENSNPTGIGSIASIAQGFYFVKNTFVQVSPQTIVLDKYKNTPSYKIGLDVVESIVTSEDDETLLDNAQGEPNFSAPGADRYKIDLILAKKAIDDSDDEIDFIQLIRVSNGVVNKKVVDTDYSLIEKTLARRTYDESGDYTVRNFQIDVREFRNNFRGAWLQNQVYLAGDVVIHEDKYYTARQDGTSSTTPPTVTIGSTSAVTTGLVWTFTDDPLFNRGINDVPINQSISAQTTNKNKLSIGLEPGKAYVRGYEIEKIATEYIPIEKARTTVQRNNVKIPATIGSYVIADNVNSLPNVLEFPAVDLYNQYTASVGVAAGVKVGTARIRYVEFNNDTVQGTQQTRYKISLFDIKMLEGRSFSREAKQLFIAGGSAATTFTADIFPVLRQLSGSITAATSVTVTGTATLFTNELAVGDYIIVGSDRRRVTAIASNNELTVNAALTVTGEVFYRASAQIYESENEPLLFAMTYPYVSSVRDAEGDNNTSYTAADRFVQVSTITGATSTITLSAAGTDTFASPADPDNYLVLDNTTGEIVAPISVVYGGTQQQIVIEINEATSKQYVIIAAVNRSGSSTEKTKTLATETIAYVTRSDATKSEIRLGKADGVRLLRVSMDTGTFDAPNGVYGIDITDRYRFNDGQKTTYYDLASISLRSGQNPPSAPIQVVFEYFQHSTSGDHFTVNSYLSTVSYDEIPVFETIPLDSVIDFRPRISDNGLTFVGSTRLPKRGIDIEADFQHYLGRKDKIALNQDGSFFAVTGTADLNPKYPSDPASGMVLYKLDLFPYNYDTDQLNVERIDNKRYTMRDIGGLEKRIDKVEYYTSLSMLEQEAQSLEIQDEFGLSRFKNGFIVDNFTGHNIGDVSSEDYKCSVDMENGELRPFFNMQNINLIEENNNDQARAAAGYAVTGELVTLPYTETEMVAQLSASRAENVNPFAIFTFIGNVDLTPASDEWFETERLPDVIKNVEGNFNAIYTALESSGALGTVWNAWQTQWTGTPQVLDRERVFIELQSRTNTNRLNELGISTRGWRGASRGVGRRRVTVETTATQVGQTRTGIRTTVVPRVDREITDDRVVSRALIPYIRSRNLMFVVRGLKPNTTFTPFFDSVNVSAFTQMATIIKVDKPVSSNFTFTQSAGSDSDEVARLINGDVETALSKGDVLFVKQRGVTVYTKDNAPATAVVALVTNDSDLDESALHVVNINGTFQAGDIVEGTLSGVTSTVSTVGVTPNIGDALTTNATGDLVGLFDIPNTESNRFRTGIREFKLSDDATDNSAGRTSFARRQYHAEGILETKQATVTATRNAEVRNEAVNSNRTIIQNATRISQDSGWYDPLAQTFLVDSDGGAFITSVDIFFATKDNNIPVRLEIREVVNGYPGKNILPFSKVVMPSDEVVISDNTVETTEGEVLPAPVATRFTFESPVYLQDVGEYCIVLLSDSNNYRVWISQLGEQSVVSGNIISEQPYAGVLFKSQNASTWTANQYQDLMFRINKARFTANQFGEVNFVNSEIPKVTLLRNPFYCFEGSTYIRVSHQSHGFMVGSSVVISGASDFAGIPAIEINTTHTVVAVENDSYIIQVTTPATFTGNFGGVGIRSTQNILYSVVQPIIQEQVLSGTNIIHQARTFTGRSVHGTELPYQSSDFYAISPNENNQLTTVQLIGTKEVESVDLSGEKSFKLRSLLITENENISPVIDVARLSAILVENKVNQPTEANINFDDIDTRNVVTANTSIDVSGGRYRTTNATARESLQTIDIGKYIVVTGFTDPANNGKFLVTSVEDDGTFTYVSVDTTLVTEAAGDLVTINILERFVDEIAPKGSSSIAKYVTRKIRLENPSSFLKIRFAADVATFANVDIYYKLQDAGTNVDFETTPYVKATPTRSVVKSDDGVFRDVQYDINGLPAYDAVQIKIVINSVAQADIARIKDLVAIACV